MIFILEISFFNLLIKLLKMSYPKIYHIFFIRFFYLILIQKLILNKSEEFEKKIIVLPIKSYYPKIIQNDERDKFLASIIKRKIYWESENENGQKIPVIMALALSSMHTSNSVGLFFLDESIESYYKPNSNDICNFNYKISQNYKCVTPYDKSFYLKNKLCYAKEKFKFYKDTKMNKENINLFDIEFIHTVNDTEICLFDGLQLTNEYKNKEINFFNQMKNNINSKFYSWMIKFNSSDEGYFIFGDILNNDNIHFMKGINREENFESVYEKPFQSGTIFWKLSFAYLYLGNNITANNFEVNIEISSEFLRVPDKIFSKIKILYFSDYFNYKFMNGHPICFEKYILAKFKGIYCYKKEFLQMTNNYKILPAFNFYSQDLNMNITFKPDELFKDYHNNLYFLIVHDTEKEKDEYNIGTILLKKYNIIFDPESKKLSILKFYKKNQIFNSKKNIYISIVITLLLSAILFCFIGIKCGKKLYQTRKKKANELNDEYDYSSINKINNNKGIGIIPNKDINNKEIYKGINEYSMEMTKTK